MSELYLHLAGMDQGMARQLSLFDDAAFYESADVEFKAAKGGLPGSLWETYSAFANSNGGTIFLGITEGPDGAPEFHGVRNGQQLVDNLWSLAHNRGKVSANLLSDKDVQIVDVEGKSIIRVHVRRASRAERPVFLDNDPMGKTFRRDHTGDYRCTSDEVRRMFADQAAEPADSRILPDFGLDDLHFESIRRYRNRVAASNPTHPWLLEDDLGLLRKLGGWRRDRSSGTEGLTVAGLLMFGHDDATRGPEALPQFQLDYRERLGEDPEQRWSDRLTLDGTWVGNLFEFYSRMMPRLAATLKTPFQIDPALYRYDDTSVGAALREGVVNALIHADYSGQGGIVIDRYADRIEISNPGTLLISHEQLLRGGISECRNKSLQLMFQMMGAGDKAGSGLDKIRTSWAAARFRAPDLRETQRPDRVELSLPMMSILPDSALEQLETLFGARLRKLSPDDIQILVMTLEEGSITNLRLQEVLTIHRTDLTKILQRLVKSEFLLRSGSGRWTKYVLPAGESLDTLSSTLVNGDSNTANVAQSPAGRPPPGGASHSSNNEGTTEGTTEGTSEGSLRVPPGTQSGDDDGAETAPSAEMWERLMRIGASARARRWLAVEEQRDLVVRLCREAGWLTKEQLAQLLGRSGENLRDRLLNTMVRDGILRLKYSSKNHPSQAYALDENGSTNSSA